MNDSSDQSEELYSHQGVLWLNTCVNKDEDSQCAGTLSIVDCKGVKCIEWKASDVSVDSDTNDPEWTMVNTTGRSTRNLNGTNETTNRTSQFHLDLANLRSFKITKHGQQMILMQRDSNQQSLFLFQNGNADSFVSALHGIIKTEVSRKDRHLYKVLHQVHSKAVDQSFDELQLFPENKSDYMWNFVKDFHNRPYEITMTAFSKLTDALLYGRSTEEKRVEEEVAELLTQSWTPADGGVNAASEEYEVIGGVPPLPPCPPVTRGPPLMFDQWTQFQDEEGRVTDVNKVKKIIFRGGIDPPLRYEVWKFLLDYFPWSSTNIDRQNIRKQKTDEYFRMKLQWKTISPGQEERFADYRERKSLVECVFTTRLVKVQGVVKNEYIISPLTLDAGNTITEKDAKRTDRTITYFAGDDNPNLQLLQDILMTYVMYNFDLGYVQGMSDLLSPILCLMSNEADAFWCFVGFMNRVYRNFDLDQSGMKAQLNELQMLLSVVDSELITYIRQHDSGNMFFCFRWLLVLFKREFSHADIQTLWEVLWTDLPCQNFHLLICSAILNSEKNAIMEGNYGFTEILKHINELSMQINLNSTLCTAEKLFNQLNSASQLPDNVRQIVGLKPTGEPKLEESVSDVPDNTAVDNDSALKLSDVSEQPESLGAVTLLTSHGEAAYDCSIQLNYL